MIKLMQWPSTKQLLLLWLLLLGIFSSYARHGFHVGLGNDHEENIGNFHSFVLPVLAGVESVDSCSADFVANSLNNKYRLVLFSNLSSTTIGVPNGEIVYFWDFGDGILSNDKDPRHSYVSNGVYNVCLVQTVRDSVSGQNYCIDTICKSVVVNYQPPPCEAGFVVDTANSYFSNVVLWNKSVPNSLDSSYTLYFKWYFGDGDSSQLAFPSHTYATNGMYEVCLTVWSYDSINNVCSDTHCDSVGVDSTGALIYKKGSSGFTINVMDPYRIGIQEPKVPSIDVYPNPAKTYVEIKSGNLRDACWTWELVDVNGKVLKKGNEMGDSHCSKKIDVLDLNEGLYFIRISTNGRFPVSCYKLRVDR